MVHAWAVDHRLLLGQVATDEKSNEVTAVPKLLAMLSLKGCIVTAEAMNCQRTTCAQIAKQDGDYVIALKGNQGSLHDDVRFFLEDSDRPTDPCHTTVDNHHGHIETRTGTVCASAEGLQHGHGWPALGSIGKMVRMREAGTKTSAETPYYLLSTPLSAERLTEVARAHWGVGNGLHWILDVTMNEDQTRHCKDNGAENITPLRRLALNLAKLEGSKGSMKGKLKRAGWNDAFLASSWRSSPAPHMQ
jgi:predicted transposase YbfD/YdcC